MAKKSNTELFNTVVNMVLLKGDTVIICINLTDEANTPPLEQVLFKVTAVPTVVCLNNWLFVAA